MESLQSIYHEHIKGHSVTTDSRNIQKGDVFIALRGDHFDGNRFACQALEKGASIAIVDDPGLQGENHCLYVKDTLQFLQEVAHYHRKQLHIPILGITGTNGKTTTKELCHAVLSTKYKTFATQGNFNNHIGVPLTLLSMNENTEFGIVEMGANHPHEIKILCDIADPDFGIITNIGQAHLEGFGSYENIIATKKELYDHILRKNGKVFVNASDSLLMELTEEMNRYTYGMTGQLLKGEIKQTIPYLVYALKTLKGDLYIKTHLTGGYNFDNALAASALGIYFGIDPLQIQQAIESYRPSNLRSQLIQTEHNTVILDAYNANPSSMRVSLINFKDIQATHKVIILGEMLELGSFSEQAHREMVRLAAESHSDRLFLIGNNFAHYADSFNFITWFQNTEALMKYLKEQPFQDAYVFVKGSRGNKLERIVEYL